MIPQDNTSEQNENLKEMNYSSEKDIFNQEEHISLDGNGNPILHEKKVQKDWVMIWMFQVQAPMMQWRQ